MITLKTIFLIFINLNILGIIAIFYYSSTVQEDRFLLEPIDLQGRNLSTINKALKPSELQKIYTITSPIDSYQFEDQKLANYVLNQLNVDQVMKPTNYSNFTKVVLGLKFDDLYCKKAQAYFTMNPEETFEGFNVLMDFPASHTVRKDVVPAIGSDFQKHITVAQPAEKRNTSNFNISARTNGFFINDMVHNYQQIGKTFACLTQTYNHVPGHSNLNRKDKAAESLVEYSKKYENRPQCFNSSKFFPKTWVLYIEDQCKEFFDHINSPAYDKLKEERTIVYIRKQGAGAHMAKGVQPMDEDEEKEIRETWKNGTGCGKVKKNYIIQDFVHNPLLLLGHKFDFRIYMLLASANPTMLYYHDGFLRVSVHKYDKNSKDKSVLLTNTELSKDAFKEARDGKLINGMNETELRNFQMWNFNRLHNYLMENNITNDPKWLDNYLRPEFKKAMIHLVRMAQGPFVKISAVYEVFGVDFMLDDKLNLWFLECNSSPVMTGTSEEKEIFMIQMLKDHFDIVIGLLRSRTKRIITYVNKVVIEIKSSKMTSGKYELRGLAQKKLDFQQVIKNKFEPEYLPAANNTWSLIIDENQEGVDRYMGHIPAECL